MTTEYVLMSKETGLLGIGLKAILKDQDNLPSDEGIVISISKEESYFWLFSYCVEDHGTGIYSFLTFMGNELPKDLELLGEL